VRAALLDVQRRLGAEGGVVVEGRDVGTVVFPAAEAKFYLDASAEVRAGRRAAELRAAGQAVDEGQTKAEMQARDQRDSTRAAAPLRQADDATYVDSSSRSIDVVVDLLISESEKSGPAVDKPLMTTIFPTASFAWVTAERGKPGNRDGTEIQPRDVRSRP
jgi:cytidylate kinase